MDVDNESKGKRSDSTCFACWTVLAGVCYYRNQPLPNTNTVEEFGRFVGKLVEGDGRVTIWDTIGAGLWSVAQSFSNDGHADESTNGDEHNTHGSNSTNEVISYEEE